MVPKDFLHNNNRLNYCACLKCPYSIEFCNLYFIDTYYKILIRAKNKATTSKVLPQNTLRI